MLGWRRRAKAEHENEANQQRLSELVNQTLMENFGPYGSFAITRRSSTDTDDIFHTVLAASVARDIVTTLTSHGVFKVVETAPASRTPLAPISTVDVPAELAKAVTDAAPRSNTLVGPVRAA
jgi:hypothetical protein